MNHSIPKYSVQPLVNTENTIKKKRRARRFALLARIVIVALAAAMALRQTGVANEIVNLAFGLTLGAAAVAFALAFGLGGRDMAAHTLQEWRALGGTGAAQPPKVPAREIAPQAPSGL
jgi:hypothetical protein